MTQCKACGKATDLRDSHIIPEWAFKVVYTKKHKFAPIGVDGKPIVPQQKGWREPLLCGACEVYLSRLENALLRDVRYIKSGIRQVASKDGMLLSFATKQLTSYGDFKRAVLSIFWRMSVSKRAEFAKYSLGHHEELIRDYVFNAHSFMKWAEYPLSVLRLTIGQKYENGIMMLYPNTAMSHGIRIHSVALYGLQLNVWIYRPRPDGAIRKQVVDIEQAALSESGRIVVVDFNIMETIGHGNVYEKLVSPEVRAFYKRYS